MLLTDGTFRVVMSVIDMEMRPLSPFTALVYASFIVCYVLFLQSLGPEPRHVASSEHATKRPRRSVLWRSFLCSLPATLPVRLPQWPNHPV